MPKEIKKEWTTPKLIILVRGKREENILAACKTISGAPGATQAEGQCKYYFWSLPEGEHCNFCSSIVSS